MLPALFQSAVHHSEKNTCVHTPRHAHYTHAYTHAVTHITHTGMHTTDIIPAYVDALITHIRSFSRQLLTQA